jgi:tetratricopeptide (TPR) repeat protein
MLSSEELNNIGGVLRAGREVLVYLPDNLRALLSLASAIPNSTQDQDGDSALLGQAEEYARRALEVLREKRIPVELPLEEWATERDRLTAQAHEALGHIAVKRGDLDLAVSQLRQAVEGNPVPEGRQFFRLGMVYWLKGRSQAARTALLRAAELGPDLIRERSLQELAKLPPSSRTGEER